MAPECVGLKRRQSITALILRSMGQRAFTRAMCFSPLNPLLTSAGTSCCRGSDPMRSDALRMLQSSQETLPSPRGEYLSYMSGVFTPRTRWNRCMAFFQLNAVQRVVSAIVLAPIVTAFLWLSPAFATSTVCSFVASACSYEYACLSNRIRLRILTKLEALEGIWNEDSADPRWSNEVPLHNNRGGPVTSQTAEEDAMSDRTFLSHSLLHGSSTNNRERLHPLCPSEIDLRSRREEQEEEEEEIARVEDELRDQEARLSRHAVSYVALVYFYGNDKLAAACVSLVLCVASSALFLTLIERAQTIQSTEFYESRWFYSITTSFVAGFCACMAPDWQYALTILVQYGVFTVLAMYSTGCPLNDFSCGIGLDPEVALLIGMLTVLICRSTVCHSGVEAFLTFMLDVLGLFYISGTLSVLVAFVDDERRLLYRELLIALLYIVWASDTGAYITGKALEFGKYPYYNPLAPHLSKNKDYEGTLGAIIFGIGAMAIISQILDLPGSFGYKVLFTVAAVITGRCGDLFESLLKRAAGVKDSGKLIPGHGGMLDRIDALMFATLVFSRYYPIVSSGNLKK